MRDRLAELLCVVLPSVVLGGVAGVIGYSATHCPALTVKSITAVLMVFALVFGPVTVLFFPTLMLRLTGVVRS